MSPVTVFVLGCVATGAIFALGGFTVGIGEPSALLAMAIFAGGIQALFFLVWYLIHVSKPEPPRIERLEPEILAPDRPEPTLRVLNEDR